MSAEEKHHNLHRNEFAFRLLCAFNNVPVEYVDSLIPEDRRMWMNFANPFMADAWGRVAEEARKYVLAEIAADSNPGKDPE
jgi:hypothetical protein